LADKQYMAVARQAFTLMSKDQSQGHAVIKIHCWPGYIQVNMTA